METLEHSAMEEALTLEELLAEITTQNLHSEIDSGSPVDEEAW